MALSATHPLSLRPRAGFISWRILIAQLCLFGMAAVFLGYTGRDDSHITYFVADALADGRGIVNYNSADIEQSSSLLFAAILGGIVWLSDLPAATLGPFLSATMLVFAMGLAAAAMRDRADGAMAGFALLSPPSLYWALSGMENSFYLFLLLGFAVALARRALLGVLAMAAMLSLTRPEAPFVLAAALTLLAFWNRRRLAGTGAALIGCAVAIAARLLFGLNVFPNPVFAKQADSELPRQILTGLRYIVATAISLPFSTICLTLAGLLLLRHLLGSNRSSAAGVVPVLTALGLSILSFSVASGGDWMEAGRFVSGAYALLLMAALLAATPSVRLVGAAAIIAAGAFDVSQLARQGFGGVPLWYTEDVATRTFTNAPTEKFNRIHKRDIGFIDKAIPVLDAAATQNRPMVIASIQAGMVPYYLERRYGARLRFVDLFGLSTTDIHSCRGDAGWRFDPYADLDALQSCTGLRFDFIYDLDPGQRQGIVKAAGCRIVVVDDIRIEDAPWKAPLEHVQFLADCRPQSQ